MLKERLRTFAVWLVAAGISGPVGILLHELGHYAVAAISGFPEAKMSFASVNYRDSERFWHNLAGGDRTTSDAIYPVQRAGLSRHWTSAWYPSLGSDWTVYLALSVS